MPGENKKNEATTADQVLRVIVAGPDDWRGSVVKRIQTDGRFTVVGEIEADVNVVEIARVHSADVLVSTVDPEFVAPATKLAKALQKNIPALAVVLVLPPMHGDELSGLVGYRSVWSMVTTGTCEDTEKFIEVLWSACRGMIWIDPPMFRRLNEVRAVSKRRSTPVAGFHL